MANKGCFTKASTGILFGETLCSAEGKLPGAAFKAIEGQWHRLPLSCFCRDTSFRISASGLALSLEVGRLLRFSCLLCITISHPDFTERCLTGATCRNLTRSRRRRLFADLEMVNRGRIHKERFLWCLARILFMRACQARVPGVHGPPAGQQAQPCKSSERKVSRRDRNRRHGQRWGGRCSAVVNVVTSCDLGSRKIPIVKTEMPVPRKVMPQP